MVNLNEVIERLKDILAEELSGKRILDRHVAEALEINQPTFASLKSRGSVPYQQLLDFCARKKISINWLLYDQAPESLVDSTNRYNYVRYFADVSASAGGGAYVDDEAFENLAIEGIFSDRLGGERQLQYIDAINVSGDSMEPTLSDGDIVFVDRSKNDYSRSGIFVIANEYGLHIKRLQKRIDGQVDIISDNESYSIMTMGQGEIEVIGKVVGVFGEVD